MTAGDELVTFEVRAEGSVGKLYKSEETGDFVIWGPASVEVVDKEDDRIRADALEDALPQLLKRGSLSFEHTDQIVGEVLDTFETEEPQTVEIGDQQVTTDTFKTDVMSLDGMEDALYVAGKVYDDTEKAREVREEVEKGNINSYSISGEAVATSMAVEDGRPVTDIEKIDLSAVTLCREGMNQFAKFGVVQKRDVDEPSDAPLDADTATDLLKATMSDDPLTKSGMEDLLDKTLPDGDLATTEDVRSIAREQAHAVVKENATNTADDKEGSPEQPSGDSDSPVEQDPDYSGDAPDETASDSDKVEEKSGSFTMEELKSALPSDQFKAIQPVLEEKAGDLDDPMEEDALDEPQPDPDPSPEPEAEPESDPAAGGVEPSPEPSDGPGAEEDEGMDVVEPDEHEDEDVLVEEKAKSLGLDPHLLTEDQKQRVAKADVSDLETANGVSAPAGEGTSPSQSGEMTEDDLAKSADGLTMAGSNFFDGDGGVKQ